MIRCRCGIESETVALHRVHIDACTCPYNAPADWKLFAIWARKVRRKTKAELERLEKSRVRTAALRSNPTYQEHAKQKREARRAHLRGIMLILVPTAYLAAGGLL